MGKRVCVQKYPLFIKKIRILVILGGLNCWHMHERKLGFSWIFDLGMLIMNMYMCACVLNWNVLRVEKLKSSRSHCFVKARFKCLLSDNSRLRLSLVAALLGQLPGFLLSYFTWLTLLWYIHKFIHNNSNLIDYFKNVFPDSSDTTWNQPAVNLFSASVSPGVSRGSTPGKANDKCIIIDEI